MWSTQIYIITFLTFTSNFPPHYPSHFRHFVFRRQDISFGTKWYVGYYLVPNFCHVHNIFLIIKINTCRCVNEAMLSLTVLLLNLFTFDKVIIFFRHLIIFRLILFWFHTKNHHLNRLFIFNATFFEAIILLIAIKIKYFWLQWKILIKELYYSFFCKWHSFETFI